MTMVYQYVPILRWKRGERVALQNLSTSGKNDVIPLIVLENEQYKGSKETKSKPATTAASHLANEILRFWGKGTFYLDATALHDKPNGQHPIDDIAASCRAIGLDLMPCTNLSASTAYVNAVQSAFALDNAGVALRVDIGEFATAQQWVSAWTIPLSDTDLIADLSNNVRVVHQMLPATLLTFQNLHQATQWRIVTVAGSSMPPNFTGLAQGTHLIPRVEKQIWDHISQNAGYKVDYGDYATVPLGVMPADIAYGFPINVRYTLVDEFLICRGVRTTGLGGVDMDTQLRRHARTIAPYHNRNALPHCWADSFIDAIAASTKSQGNLETWVQIGVNRHIELVRSILP